MGKKVVVDEAAVSAKKAQGSEIIIDAIKVLNGEEGAKRHIVKYQEGHDKKVLESRDAASDVFYLVFAALGEDAAGVLEFPEEYRYGVTTRSVRFRYEGSDMAMEASISIMKHLKESGKDCLIHSPYKKVTRPTTSMSDGEPTNEERVELTMHTKGARERLKAMHQHAVDYVNNKRSAIQLFEKDGKPTAEAIGKN